DEAALRCLMALGCDGAQGYHLSRPVAAARIPTSISQYQLMRSLSKSPKSSPSLPFTDARAWRRRRTATRQQSECLRLPQDDLAAIAAGIPREAHNDASSFN